MGCQQKYDISDDPMSYAESIYWEEDSLDYLKGNNNIASYFFPDTFVLQNKDILFFANRLTSAPIYKTKLDSLMIWYEDVRILCEQNKTIRDLGLDSAIAIVENKILSLEVEFGCECTLARVNAAYRMSNVWLFRTMDNYIRLFSMGNSDKLKTVIEKEMADWWAFMYVLYDEIHHRIGRYGGSDIGEAIGDTESYILECRANQLKSDFTALNSKVRSFEDSVIVRSCFFDIDTYLFDSALSKLEHGRYLDNSSMDSLAIVSLLDYLDDLGILRNNLITWIESRRKVSELLSDKRQYQENTVKYLRELTDLDIDFRPQKHNL